ncbi:hypothetical protein [Cohnella soli]|uniref:Uncharacterized protein n=1 Tax=Cohnella soli TaxID=425005 RepID=A0ABW0HR63_9BACL
MEQSIEGIQKAPFEVGDGVELVSDSYKDAGHCCGDIGKVIDTKKSVLPSGHIEWDLRVTWENGKAECWIYAKEFTGV